MIKKIKLGLVIVLMIVISTSCGNTDEKNSNKEINLNSFKTTDVYGSFVDETIFEEYDLTMINIWATWCGYCVQEMPELAQLKDKLPENVNLISICSDSDNELELAKDILKESKVGFTTLSNNEELKENLVNYISSYPTTIFVDSEGNLVGKGQMGLPAPEGKIIDAYLKLIEENLKLIDKQ